MTRRRQSELDHTATRDKLLESGRKYFLKQGFQAAPLRKIAADAGFTSGAFYGYFASKEELFYAVTEETAEGLTAMLNAIQEEILSLPPKEQLFKMCSLYREHIPELVDYLLPRREDLELILHGAKGTKYEHFADWIKGQNTENITRASQSAGDGIQALPEELTQVLMDGYIDMLIRLILSGKSRDTIVACLQAIAQVYEAGMLSLMRKGE